MEFLLAASVHVPGTEAHRVVRCKRDSDVLATLSNGQAAGRQAAACIQEAGLLHAAGMPTHASLTVGGAYHRQGEERNDMRRETSATFITLS